ncbi:MAG: hypothetical protein ACK58L_22820, partial [Planctomycetota bacterium]
MAKKGFNIKAFFLNHAEKLGVAAIALLGLTGLATASWKTCDKQQDVLVRIAEQTKSDWLTKNQIPEDRLQEFSKTPDVEGLALRMASPNEDIARFSTSRRWNPPIVEVQDKLATVKVRAPEDPEASLLMMAMVEQPEEEEESEEELTQKDEDKEKKNKGGEGENKDLEDIFRPRDAVAGMDAAGGGLSGEGTDASALGLTPGMQGAAGSRRGEAAGGPGLGMAGGPGAGSGSGAMSGRRGSITGKGMGGMSSGMQMGSAMGGMGSGMQMGGSESGLGLSGMGMGMGSNDLGMDNYGGYGMGIPTEKKVRLMSGVSVRLVFDLYQQTIALAEALHIPEEEAAQYIDFVNLQIERKRAVVGPDPWAGAWEPLSLDEVGEILELSLGTDPDIVQPAVVRPEITMPLPRRRSGEWSANNASHRRLENFELSAEEKEVIEKHKQKMLEEAQKLKATLPREQAKSEGFRRFQLGAQDLANTLGDANANVTDSLFSELNAAEEEGEAAAEEDDKNKKKKESKFKDKKALQEFLNRQMAAQRLLLVRFMDFSCDRGTTYQYRVRLEMRNPNFDRPIDLLEEPEQADLPTIFSEWSEPSAAVYVPHGYRYYPQKVALGETANFTMYYENESAGTPALAPSIQVPIGTRIGGKTNVDVVDLGKDTLKVEEVEFKSRDFLASVTEAPRISKSDFPELRDYFSSTQKPFGERVTVVDSNGAIVVRYAGDSVQVGDRAMTAASDRGFIAGLLDLYKDWRESEATAMDDPYN